MKKTKKQLLSIKKFQILKIKNPQYIIGGVKSVFHDTDTGQDPPKTRPALGISGMHDGFQDL